jgi:hypothetical protein
MLSPTRSDNSKLTSPRLTLYRIAHFPLCTRHCNYTVTGTNQTLCMRGSISKQRVSREICSCTLSPNQLKFKWQGKWSILRLEEPISRPCVEERVDVWIKRLCDLVRTFQRKATHNILCPLKSLAQVHALRVTSTPNECVMRRSRHTVPQLSSGHRGNV